MVFTRQGDTARRAGRVGEKIDRGADALLLPAR
jgi:hypothetical protein